MKVIRKEIQYTYDEVTPYRWLVYWGDELKYSGLERTRFDAEDYMQDAVDHLTDEIVRQTAERMGS